jgi:2-isopropylmalate synthase
VPVNKPIVGDNVFSHGASMHQNSVVNYAPTFEIMDPAKLGISRNSEVLGRQSSREAFEERVAQLGYELSNNTVNQLFVQFRELANRKKFVFDRDLEALINSKKNEIIEHYRLICHNVLSGNQTIATASVQWIIKINCLKKPVVVMVQSMPCSRPSKKPLTEKLP